MYCRYMLHFLHMKTRLDFCNERSVRGCKAIKMIVENANSAIKLMTLLLTNPPADYMLFVWRGSYGKRICISSKGRSF